MSVSRVLLDTVVAAGAPWSGILRRGQVLQIIDLEGQQGVDFLCYAANNPEERYHAANTIKKAATLRLTQGPCALLRHRSANDDDRRADHHMCGPGRLIQPTEPSPPGPSDSKIDY